MTTRDTLLTALKNARGTWLSGETLSNELSMSRTAVWKHIRTLRAEGYHIESASKKGYLLGEDSDVLLPGEISRALPTSVLGRGEIVHLRETSSTNVEAKAIAESGADDGTVVVAETQTGGKGRLTRSWFSPHGNGLYVSVILRPAILPTEALKIPLMTAVAVAGTVGAMGVENPTIKWPNDILVGGRKIAGILTEISTQPDAVDYVIVGVGINVNTEQFPDELEAIATSIFMETGAPATRLAVLREYLTRLEEFYTLFTTGGFDPVMARWKELTSVEGRRIAVHTVREHYEGEVEKVDADGALILRDDEGVVHRVLSGDVTYL